MSRARKRDEISPDERAGQLAELLARIYYDARRDYSIDLSHRAIRVLQLCAYGSEPPRIDGVANQLGCAVSTASELVKRLQGKGLVVRQRSQKDERVVELHLTERGKSTLLEHTTLDGTKLTRALASLSATEQAELIRLTGEMMQALRETGAA